MFDLQGEDDDDDDDSEPAEDMEAYEESGMLEEDTVSVTQIAICLKNKKPKLQHSSSPQVNCSRSLTKALLQCRRRTFYIIRVFCGVPTDLLRVNFLKCVVAGHFGPLHDTKRRRRGWRRGRHSVHPHVRLEHHLRQVLPNTKTVALRI